jgi:zinc protease
LLDRLLGDLPETGAPLPPSTTFAATGGTTVIDYAQPQSTIIWAHEGLEQSDPDFFAAYIMNHILGGGSFSSRLTSEVREKRGLTYGIGTYLSPRDYAAIIGGSVKTGNATAAQVIDLIRAEWVKMANEGPTEAELISAQKYLTGAYALRFDGNAKIAGILVGMQTQELGIDYIKTRNDRVNAVTLDQIRAVANRWLKPDEMRFVVVGQPDGVASTN